jgi:hypothetical protein
MKNPDWSNPELERKMYVDVGTKRFYNPEDMKQDRISWLARTANSLFGVRLSFYERAIVSKQAEEPDLGKYSNNPDTLLDALEATPETRSLDHELTLLSLAYAERHIKGLPTEDLSDRIDCLRMELFELQTMAGELRKPNPNTGFDLEGMHRDLDEALGKEKS